MSGPRKFELPFRPPYELYAAVAWGVCGVVTIWTLAVTSLPKFPFTWVLSVSVVLTGIRAWQGLNQRARIQALASSPLEFIEHEELHFKVSQKEIGTHVWLGDGFIWDIHSANRAAEVQLRGIHSIVKNEKEASAHWLHGMAEFSEDQYWASAFASGHTLVLGTTGAGKTRLLDLMITQLASRGLDYWHCNPDKRGVLDRFKPGAKKTSGQRECIIIIDPKGDKGLYENAKRLCEEAGEPDRFVYFHAAFPEKSCAIDVMRNFNSVTELATRVSTILPSETGNDPFVAFSWKALHDICAGLMIVHSRPNLMKLRRYVEAGLEPLLEKTLMTHFVRVDPNWTEAAKPYMARQNGNRGQTVVQCLIEFYRAVIGKQPNGHNPTLDGLINGFQHDRVHYQKMTASLIPVLTMLTSGHLSDLLSPDPVKDPDRLVTDMASVVRDAKVCYIGLNSLADGVIGSAIGSMILSDLTAVCGDRYNYGIPGEDEIPVNLFSDEAGETVNAPFIQVLNKGRGAGFRAYLAAQTVADFIVRIGSVEGARKVLGNINNMVALRIHDPESREFFSDKVGKANLQTLQMQYRQGSDSSDPSQFGGTYSEGLAQTEGYLIPPAVLSTLPDLHFFATLQDGRCIKCRIPILVNDRDAALAANRARDKRSKGEGSAASQTKPTIKKAA